MSNYKVELIKREIYLVEARTMDDAVEKAIALDEIKEQKEDHWAAKPYFDETNVELI